MSAQARSGAAKQPEPTDVAKLPTVQPDPTLVSTVSVFAKTLLIKSAQGYEEASQRLLEVKAEIEKVKKQKDSVFKPINAGLRAFSALVMKALQPLEEAERAIKRAMVTWQDTEDRRIAEEQRRANEKAENERKRLLEAAQRNEAKGDMAKADVFQQRAAQVVAPVFASAVPQVAGITPRKVLEVTINAALLPREYLVANEPMCRKVGLAMGLQCNIPGITVREVNAIAAATGGSQ